MHRPPARARLVAATPTRHGQRAARLIGASLLCAGVALGACGVEPAPEDGDAATAETEQPAVRTVVVDYDALQVARYVVDLTGNVRWLFTEPAAELPLDRVDIICPNGQRMQMRDWLWRQQSIEGHDVTGGRPFVLQSQSISVPVPPPAQAVPECAAVCTTCSDGAEVCWLPCEMTEYAPLFDEDGTGAAQPPDDKAAGPGTADPPDDDTCGSDGGGSSTGGSTGGSDGSSGGSSTGGSTGGASGGGASGGSAGGGAGNPGW